MSQVLCTLRVPGNQTLYLSLVLQNKWGNVVSIMTRLQAEQLRNYGLIHDNGKRFFFSPNRPDQLHFK
jgi:hypothetical protein